MPHFIDFIDAAIFMLPVVAAAIAAPRLFLSIVRPA
jgi:hypothetical protein